MPQQRKLPMTPWSAILVNYLDPKGEAPIHYLSLRIEQPAEARPEEAVAGRQPGTGRLIPAGHKFRIASISKTMTATLVLQLWEEGRLSLDDRITDRLSAVPYLDIDRLHRIGGRSYGRAITVEHLLRHTSGLADYLLDDPRFIQGVLDNPGRQWSARSLLETYYRCGLADKAVAPPGERMYYSDTNYLLLALLVEQVTGKSLAQNLTERLFIPLGMTNSYLEFYQPSRGDAPLVYPYQGAVSTEAVNTSFDWGGGGIVATHGDLHRFLRNLLQGRLFREPATLARMLDVRPEGNSRFTLGAPTSDYGLGIRRLRLDGHTLLGHSGAWGCVMLYEPAHDRSLTLAVHQAGQQTQLGDILRDVLRQIDKAN